MPIADDINRFMRLQVWGNPARFYRNTKFRKSGYFLSAADGAFADTDPLDPCNR